MELLTHYIVHLKLREHCTLIMLELKLNKKAQNTDFAYDET